MKISRSNLQQLLKFLISGSLAAATEYLVFLLLAANELNIIVSQSVSFSVGLVISFAINRTWVFGRKGNFHKQAVLYLSLAVTNLILSNLVLIFLTGPLHLVDWIAKVIVMGCIASWNFFIFKKFIFS